MAGLLSLERRENVAIVTLQRPEKRNALSIDLRVELAEAFGALGGDGEVGAVVLTGAGPAFCSGMDTTQFGGDRAARSVWSRPASPAFARSAGVRKPVIAAVNGPALAGGFALALLCDLRLAAEEASFGFPELPRGSRRATQPRVPPCRLPSRPSSRSPAGCSTRRARSGWESSVRCIRRLS